MADLTTHSVWTCKSNVEWTKQVTGSKGDLYTVEYGKLLDNPIATTMYGWMCSCPAYFHRRRECKHIAAVKKERCGWNDGGDPGMDAAVNAEGAKCCPSCKGEVTALLVAV